MVKWINLYQQLTTVTPVDSSLIEEWKDLLSQEIIFVPTMPPSTYNFLLKERKRRTQPLLQDQPIAESSSDWTTLQYLLGNLRVSIGLESVVKRLHTDLVDEEGKTVNVDINDLKLDLDSLRIRSLDLSNLNLKTIPKLITTLTELRSLDMSGNPGLIIESHLEEMSELTILELRSCGINELELPYLPHLELLDLRSNSLTQVPELDQVPNLKALYLQDNPLELDISIKHEQLEELVLPFKPKETRYKGCPAIKTVRVE
ncbi:MAG: leucine-rich repeat domain-containing protein [Candidatus Kariarchaeaceae archaeon]